MLQYSKRYHKKIMNSNLEEGQKVEMLSGLLDTVFRYMQEREKIENDSDKRIKKILNKDKNEINSWVQSQQ
tara:strand:- start:629 stop:841 length:213 start_codon:yes stop_codon:yes gene_type:complete